MNFSKIFIILGAVFLISCTNVKDFNYDENMRVSKIHFHAARTADMLGQDELEKYHRDIAQKNRYEAKSGMWEDLFMAVLKCFD